MKKGILWMLLSFLLVAALVLPSCAVEDGEQEEEEEEEEEEDEEVWSPYGGTIHPLGMAYASEPSSPAMADAQWGSLMWLEWIQERPIQGDVETYGQRGTDEYRFQVLQYVPMKYMKGNLLKSWEVSREKVVWHVRPGIYWAADNVDFMENRELTAEDVAADIIGFLKSPWKARFDGMITVEGVHVIDRYTLEIEFENFSNILMYYIGYEDRALIGPPETEIAGADKWENQVGTGPFMFEEYVAGSHMSFVKNPNYWGTTTINGKEYQLPFVDRVVIPIIADASTMLAALQTGKVDLYNRTTAAEWDMLDRVCPDLQKSIYGGGDTSGSVAFRCDEPPFDSPKVRAAMTMGTDIMAFKKMAMAIESPLLFYPIQPGNPAYVPLEELPADIQEQYTYNPVKAKQMLADAGYPNGFTTTLMTNPRPYALEEAALLVDQWAKIGITLNIDMVERVEYDKRRYPTPTPMYHGCLGGGGLGTPDPMLFFSVNFLSTSPVNIFAYSNPEMDALIKKLEQEPDVDEQIRLAQEASLIYLRGAPMIGLHYDPGRVYWWPWVKNYDGELSLQDDSSFSAVVKYIWIDQDLKAEMGYK